MTPTPIGYDGLMETTYTNINSPEDITEAVVMAIETVFEGYYADEPRIDWFAFLDRVENLALVNFGSDMDSPVVKHIKKMVKALRAAG